jgi:hypothetical protein
LKLCPDQIYICEHIKVRNCNSAEIIFLAGIASQGDINNATMVCFMELDHPLKYVCEYKRNIYKMVKAMSAQASWLTW